MSRTLRKRARCPRFGIIPCPGLASGVFTDCKGRAHDLAKDQRLTPKEAGADPRLQLSTAQVHALIRAGQLYPIYRHNARVIQVFACALVDRWSRQVDASAQSRRWSKAV